MLRKTYLKEYRKPFYQMLVLQGKLNKHLNKVDREAHERLDIILIQMEEKQNITEQLEAEQPMEWVKRINEIRNAAEEIVLASLFIGNLEFSNLRSFIFYNMILLNEVI